MKRIIRVLFVTIGVALLSAPGIAQAQPKGKAVAPKGGGDVKEISFEGDVVEAQFLRPDQGVTEAVVIKKRASLIQERADFVDEILKSAEDL